MLCLGRSPPLMCPPCHVVLHPLGFQWTHQIPHIAGPCLQACVLSRFSHVQPFATPWTIARQTPLSMGFSRQEHWSRLPDPLPGKLPDPGIEPKSLVSPALAGRFFTTSTPREALHLVYLAYSSCNPCHGSQHMIGTHGAAGAK